MYTFLASYLMITIPCLLMVAFVTLMERKILGLVQLRKGPVKVSVWGIFQPIADALKLFLKSILIPMFSNLFLFLSMPIFSLSLILFLWNILSFKEINSMVMYSFFLMMVFLSMGAYPMFLSGWASNSKYSLMGALRGVSQTISYEINLSLMFMILMILVQSSQMVSSLALNFKTFMFFIIPIVVLLIFVLSVMETNRTPFDFSEGESELVSGFNTEYSSGVFTLIFLAEYASILFFSLLISSFSFFPSISFKMSYIFLSVLAFSWIWLRATFPRYRYDLLMNLSWKQILPMSLNFTLFFLIFKGM